MNATTRAIGAFKETMLDSDPVGTGDRLDFDRWNSHDARSARYRLAMALYQNNAYSEALHRNAQPYKAAFGMDRHVRHVYNPAYRLGEFWTSRIMGGRLDPAAGDGDAEPSALPILAKSKVVQPAIARCWKDSDWQTAKGIYSRWGSVLGDVALRVVDDTAAGRSRLEVVHPSHLPFVDFDPWGRVLGYDLERWVRDPRPSSTGEPRKEPVKYLERVRLDGNIVRYETKLDGVLYPWNGVAARWDEGYGFVPLVVAHHQPIGGSFWAENCFHSGLSRFREVDDLGSKLTDAIRKETEAPMLIAGVTANEIELPEAKRTAIQYIRTNNPTATATPLFSSVNIANAYVHLQGLLDDIEKNFPELAADTGAMSGTITAEAIAQARDRATDKVQSIRPNYEGPMVEAIAMAIGIGGERGYPGYDGFNLAMYRDGEIEFSVGTRPVFGTDPKDDIAEKDAFWTMIGKQVALGVPLIRALKNHGWQEKDLADLERDMQAAPAPATMDQASTLDGGTSA